jgi:hypothetical protein
MRTTIFILTLLVSSLCAVNAQEASEIADKAAGAIDFDALEMTITLDIHDNRGNVRTRNIAVATRTFGETTKTLIRFLSPADVRGTSMLIHDHEKGGDDMWIYMPALRRTRRIAGSERSASFMGSEFTNADMGSRDTDDLNHKLTGSETVNGRDCWIIESVPETSEHAEENGYSRMVAFIDKANYHTYRVNYYDLNNELHRIMTIDDYRRQSGTSYFAFSTEVQNVQNKRKSVMVVDNFQDGSQLDESNFEVQALENF